MNYLLRLLSQGRNLITLPLYTNAFYLWLNSGIGAISGFIFWTIVARIYSPEEVGLGAAALSALGFVVTLSNLGFGYMIIRFLPEEKENAPQLIYTCISVGVTLSLLASFIFLLGLSLWSPKLLFLKQPLFFILFIFFTGLGGLGGVLSPVFIAWRRAYLLLLINSVGQLCRILLPFLLVALAAFGIVAAGGLAGIVWLTLGLFFLFRFSPNYKWKPRINLHDFFGKMPFAVGNHLSDLFLAAPNLLLPIIVVNLLGAEWGAYFYISWFLGYFLLGLLIQLAVSLLVEGSYEPGELLQITRNGLLLAIVVAILGVSFIFLMGDKLLLLFGEEYSLYGGDLLRVVALASFPGAVTYLYLGVERVRRRIKALLFTSGIVAGSVLGISYILLPQWGLIGAGIGLIIGQSLGAIIAIARSPRKRIVIEFLKFFSP